MNDVLTTEYPTTPDSQLEHPVAADSGQQEVVTPEPDGGAGNPGVEPAATDDTWEKRFKDAQAYNTRLAQENAYLRGKSEQTPVPTPGAGAANQVDDDDIEAIAQREYAGDKFVEGIVKLAKKHDARFSEMDMRNAYQNTATTSAGLASVVQEYKAEFSKPEIEAAIIAELTELMPPGIDTPAQCAALLTRISNGEPIPETWIQKIPTYLKKAVKLVVVPAKEAAKARTETARATVENQAAGTARPGSAASKGGGEDYESMSLAEIEQLIKRQAAAR